MPAPAWVADSIFYQIFPDRFANGDRSNDPPGIQPWGSPPTIWDFQGGDLRGVLGKLDYLADLGVNAIYLNPIFQAASNHRYNTSDYYQIDRHLGELEDFRSLIEEAHRRRVRVVLDGVFNHCGRGFFAFYDLMENETHSAYREWFHVRRFPLEAYGPGKAENYRAWWDLKNLPKFNTSHPDVRRFLLGVARHWIELGADGWRLDVPNEIDDDGFWAEFRETVKMANPDAYLVGEIWEADRRWAGERHFDGLMLYPLRALLVDGLLAAKLLPSHFIEQIAGLVNAFPDGFRESHYLPLGSHDTPRIRTVCGNDSRKVRMAALVQFSFPGAPAVYYGDEIGLEGGKDPDSRRAFVWTESQWDTGLREYFRSLIRLRKETPQLRRGGVAPLFADDEKQVCAFTRQWEGLRAAVVLNCSDARNSFDLPLPPGEWMERTGLVDPLGGRRLSVQGGRVRLSLAAWEGVILLPTT